MNSFVILARRFAAAACVLATPLSAHAVPAAVGACASGDAEAGFTTASCGSVCTVTGTELKCDMEVLCPTATYTGSTAAMVTQFGTSSHDVSAWGLCLSTAVKFCCVFDENDDAIDTVGLKGTDDPDEVLKFTFDLGGANERNLQPWDADPIEGFIRGQNGGDLIWGSNFAGTDYDDNLYGQNGNDIIEGNGGADFLSGGTGADDLSGNLGNDTQWGGDGDDVSQGGGGVDALCDSAGYNTCASNGGNLFSGGDGDDRIWFQQPEDPLLPCPGILPDPLSDAGAGTDQCGDNNDFTNLELPISCDSLITVVPNRCIGAN